MKYFNKILLLLLTCLLFAACSDDDNSDTADSKKGHVWKEQTDTIDKAKEVEGMILDSAEETRKAIKQQAE